MWAFFSFRRGDRRDTEIRTASQSAEDSRTPCLDPQVRVCNVGERGKCQHMLPDGCQSPRHPRPIAGPMLGDIISTRIGRGTTAMTRARRCYPKSRISGWLVRRRRCRGCARVLSLPGASAAAAVSGRRARLCSVPAAGSKSEPDRAFLRSSDSTCCCRQHRNDWLLPDEFDC
ncbi:uncharacterized protein LY79DRAFT_141922 [Colletotrichum navitas]|uniref:Uncharacterized protein n=1 Tax=Colletotrichum navitas TaxID=681940 RepID=A0AAD8QDT9_9PEZI|nr:uncharacterized protein LY79DRAFT_141922 [Colletotrichum navitas]KAK1599473.1 hypothetical protein LY79DRAFT_141922 [Colletotrichum navitas]